MSSIAVVNYGLGNAGSIINMLKKAGGKGVYSEDPEVLRSAEGLILPGVGAFDAGMGRLEETGLKSVLEELVVMGKKPILGVCLGMQLLTRGSEEGRLPGLGWVSADTRRIPAQHHGVSLRVPHMGWNDVHADSDLHLVSHDQEYRAYFVHSYCVHVDPEAVMATGSSYYAGDFCSIFEHGHIMGCQFHPEKSHRFGKELFRRYINYCQSGGW